MKRLSHGTLTHEEATRVVAKALILHRREILGLMIVVAILAVMCSIAIYSNASRSDTAVTGAQTAQKDIKAAVPEARKAATKQVKVEAQKTLVVIRREVRPIVKQETRTIIRREVARAGATGAAGTVGATGAAGAPCSVDLDPRCQGPQGPAGATGTDGADCDPSINPMCRGPAGPEGKPGKDGSPCDPMINPMCQGPPGQNGANGTDGQPGPPPQPATIQFTDDTGVSHTCLIDFTVGPSIVQSCT